MLVVPAAFVVAEAEVVLLFDKAEIVLNFFCEEECDEIVAAGVATEGMMSGWILCFTKKGCFVEGLFDSHNSIHAGID